eukprot:COSAG04_NODE_13_length_42806_cov_92.030323_7_plen_645_part_00
MERPPPHSSYQWADKAGPNFLNFLGAPAGDSSWSWQLHLLDAEQRERVVQLAMAEPNPWTVNLAELVLGVLRSIEEPSRSRQAQDVLDKVDGGTPVGNAISATLLHELRVTIQERMRALLPRAVPISEPLGVQFPLKPPDISQPQPSGPAQAQRQHGGDDHPEHEASGEPHDESWATFGPPEPVQPDHPPPEHRAQGARELRTASAKPVKREVKRFTPIARIDEPLLPGERFWALNRDCGGGPGVQHLGRGSRGSQLILGGKPFRGPGGSLAEQVAEARHWMELTGASPASALSLTIDGESVSRPAKMEPTAAKEARYMWPRLTRSAARYTPAAGAGAGVVAEDERVVKSQVMSKRDRDQIIANAKALAQEKEAEAGRVMLASWGPLVDVVRDVVLAIPPERRSKRTEAARKKAEAGECPVSDGFLAELRKELGPAWQFAHRRGTRPAIHPQKKRPPSPAPSAQAVPAEGPSPPPPPPDGAAAPAPAPGGAWGASPTVPPRHSAGPCGCPRCIVQRWSAEMPCAQDPDWGTLTGALGAAVAEAYAGNSTLAMAASLAVNAVFSEGVQGMQFTAQAGWVPALVLATTARLVQGMQAPAGTGGVPTDPRCHELGQQLAQRYTEHATSAAGGDDDAPVVAKRQRQEG